GQRCLHHPVPAADDRRRSAPPGGQLHRPRDAEGRGRTRSVRAGAAADGAGRVRGRRLLMQVPAAESAPAEPPRDCSLCPRLSGFIAGWRGREPEWHNAPVPTFLPIGGEASVRLLIVGLAPGLRGANRTGRPFTGDFAGDLLYQTLVRFGFARGTYGARPDDGLELI